MQIIDFSAVTSVLSKNPTMQNLSLSVTSLNGSTLSSTEWKRACRDFHRVNKNTSMKCMRSDIELANQLNSNETYALYSCFSLTDAATPFLIIQTNH
jgi:hypothetical protein